MVGRPSERAVRRADIFRCHTARKSFSILAKGVKGKQKSGRRRSQTSSDSIEQSLWSEETIKKKWSSSCSVFSQPRNEATQIEPRPYRLYLHSAQCRRSLFIFAFLALPVYTSWYWTVEKMSEAISVPPFSTELHNKIKATCRVRIKRQYLQCVPHRK